jgi:hypothetical protein
MDKRSGPNDASNRSKAEGDRWKSDSETVERYDQTTGDEGGGITNRPVGEEIESQASLPKRGESREGANAGHGHPRPSETEEENR